MRMLGVLACEDVKCPVVRRCDGCRPGSAPVPCADATRTMRRATPVAAISGGGGCPDQRDGTASVAVLCVLGSVGSCPLGATGRERPSASRVAAGGRGPSVTGPR